MPTLLAALDLLLGDLNEGLGGFLLVGERFGESGPATNRFIIVDGSRMKFIFIIE